MPEGQIMVVEYNGRHNAFSGMRNKRTILKIENKLDIAPMIDAQLKALKKGGYVLVKYSGELYMCERNNLDHSKPYQKHRIEYHPFMNEFGA